MGPLLNLHTYLYLESEDDGPYKTESESRISIYDIMSSHVLQFYRFLSEKGERFINILQTVDSHLSLCGSWLQVNNIKHGAHIGHGLSQRQTDFQSIYRWTESQSGQEVNSLVWVVVGQVILAVSFASIILSTYFSNYDRLDTFVYKPEARTNRFNHMGHD